MSENKDNRAITKDDSRGHRERLRDRFRKTGLSGFADYEIIEFLLSLTTPQRDCKPQAKEAISRFKNLRGVLEAPAEELQKIKGIGPVTSLSLKVIQEVAREYLKDRIIKNPEQNSSRQVFDYLYHTMRGLKKEIFKMLLLDSQNRIIEIIDMAQGTVNEAYVSPREIIEEAIKHAAVSLIFVHNHPSGNPQPSAGDKDLTRQLIYAAEVMKLKVLDHIIIGDNVYFSFTGEGLIRQYETEFTSKINDLRK